ncbi:MAG: fumarate hydratase [Oligoflexia bacterium]|nr:fumarate hydratase [Oligoflexia bacterium]
MKKRIIDDKQIFENVRDLMIKAYKSVPADVSEHIRRCFKKCDSTDEKNILASIVSNMEIAENENISLCQDTGLSVFFIEKGNVEIKGGTNIVKIINDAVSYVCSNSNFRPSVIDDPIFGKNTGDNTPAIIHIEETGSENLVIYYLAKGGGSENAGGVKMLNPVEGIQGIKNFVTDLVKSKGANACPPLIVGIGIGGTMDSCAVASKKALFREIGQRNENRLYAEAEEQIKDELNRLGIGPMGLGGKNTVMDVFIETRPRHIASLPVAVNLLCHSVRKGRVIL